MAINATKLLLSAKLHKRLIFSLGLFILGLLTFSLVVYKNLSIRQNGKEANTLIEKSSNVSVKGKQTDSNNNVNPEITISPMPTSTFNTNNSFTPTLSPTNTPNGSENNNSEGGGTTIVVLTATPTQTPANTPTASPSPSPTPIPSNVQFEANISVSGDLITVEGNLPLNKCKHKHSKKMSEGVTVSSNSSDGNINNNVCTINYINKDFDWTITVEASNGDKKSFFHREAYEENEFRGTTNHVF